MMESRGLEEILVYLIDEVCFTEIFFLSSFNLRRSQKGDGRILYIYSGLPNNPVIPNNHVGGRFSEKLINV